MEQVPNPNLTRGSEVCHTRPSTWVFEVWSLSAPRFGTYILKQSVSTQCGPESCWPDRFGNAHNDDDDDDDDDDVDDDDDDEDEDEDENEKKKKH